MARNAEKFCCEMHGLHKGKTPPDFIYLQWFGDADKEEIKALPDDVELCDVSWCDERMFESDFVYKRVRNPKKAQR